MSTKVCSKCGKEQPLENFHNNKSRKDGKLSQCKNCIKEIRKKYLNEIRMDLYSHYSDGKLECACCGDKHKEFFSIDHINGGGKQHRKKLGIESGSDFYRWLRDNNYPEGYRLLCMNCNHSFGRFNYCPHQKERKDEL